MSRNRTSHYKNKTFAEAFDELFNFPKELYQYPESLRPSMKKEKLPLELFMKGVRILLSLTPSDDIQITINHHQKTKPPYAQVRNVAWKHNLRFKDNTITCTEIEVFKIRRGRFIVSMSSSVLSQEKTKKIAEQILQLYLQRIKPSQL